MSLFVAGKTAELPIWVETRPAIIGKGPELARSGQRTIAAETGSPASFRAATDSAFAPGKSESGLLRIADKYLKKIRFLSEGLAVKRWGMKV